jgi:hypothetical protein
MFKKNYRRREVLKDWNFGLKQRFNIKCSIDLVIFIAIFTLFAVYALKHSNNLYEALLYMAIIIILFVSSHFITKQWILGVISKSLTMQSESVSETTSEIMDTINAQKKILENLSVNAKSVSSMVEKLKALSNEALSTSKNTEKQVNQSIIFSQKEYEAIASNSEKMLTLVNDFLNLSTSYENYENLNTNPLFLSYFLNSYFNSVSENILECNSEKVSINLPSNNSYLSHATLTLNNNTPYSLTYYDKNNKPKLSIIYNKFSFESS